MKLEPKLEMNKITSLIVKKEQSKIQDQLQYSDKINVPDQVEILEGIKSSSLRQITLDKLDQIQA
jgi:hypothetical protein